jgi:DnaA family protein
MKQLALPVRLRAEAIFESFSAGPNQEVVSALRASGNLPIWLWGARGSGKTHLLQAACAAAGSAAAAYFPIGIDDVEAIAGDRRWEQALFELFNEALELRTRLIFAGAVPPSALQWALGDWRSRAAACIVYQLRELDDAGRLEALRLRALQRGLQLPPETADYLLRRMPRDLTSLLGLIDDLDEASLAAQRRLTIPFIRDALERNAKTPP